MTETAAKNIHEAISNVMGKVGYVQKEKKEGGLKYSYASEAALIAALRPEIVVEKITLSCDDISGVEVREYESNNGAKMVNVSLTAKWRFVHAPSGTSIIVTSRGEGSDNSDKANNKAMTGSMKYAIRQTFMIETGDDPDASQSDERRSHSTAPQATPRVDPSGWPTAYIETILALKYFANVFELKNALKLSKELKPGVTPLAGLQWWIECYKKFRIENKLEPQVAADTADSEYLAEKARKAQDAATEKV
jgi:hypothetical protein